MLRRAPRSLIVGLVVSSLLVVAPAWGSRFGARPSAKPGPGLDLPLPDPAVPEAVVFSEAFDDITTLPGAGWSQQNNSVPLGLTNWFQGNSTVFPAHAGAPTAYIGANFNNTTGANTISNWLITPVLDFAVVGRCSFYTRTVTGSPYPDRLEIRYSTAGASTNTGGTPTSVGDFTTLVTTINPALTVGGYPENWTQFIANAPASGTGRFAMRNYIGIDTLVCEDRSPTPVGAGATIVSESCTAPNGALDPGETATVSFCLQNTGTTNTVNLVGTLQATGGVENPSVPQSYGVLVAGGPPVCRNFTFNADLALTCGAVVNATLALQDGATVYPPAVYNFTTGAIVTTTTTFSNAGNILIPATGTSGIAGPYPSAITSSGMSGVITDVDVALNGFSHTFPDDVDVVLVRPSGALALMSDVGSSFDAVGVNYTINDSAAALFADGAANPSGSYRPTNIGAGDNFPAPGPLTAYSNPATAGSATLASVFNGLGPNATWNLFIVDDVGGDAGSMSGGWSVTITSGAPVCCTGACVVTAPANITTSNAPNQCGAVVAYPPPTVAGICGQVPCTPPPGSFFPVGTTPVTCDPEVAGIPNATFNVTVNDTQPPSVTPPSPVVPNDPGLCSAVVALAPGAADNCPGVTAACVPPSGSTFPVGVTPISCTATDASGNTATAGGTVTVNDVEVPTITCPADIELELPPGSPGQNVDYDPPVVGDNCSALYDCQPPSGDFFPAGQTPVDCTATDPAGNTATCAFNVILGAVTVLEVPTVSTLGLLALGLLLAAAALVVLRRHG